MSDDALKLLIDTMRQESAAAHTETRRHFDVTAEALRNDIRAVAETVSTFDEKFERKIDDLEQSVRRGFEETQAMIRFSHAELDRRVQALEAHQRTLERAVSALEARVERLEATTH